MSNKPFNPESTTFTNIVLDKIMPKLSPNAWKVLCLALRKTEGWRDASTESGRKESDVIAISQFRKGCGIASNDTAMAAIEECINLGYLVREREDRSFRYRLNIDYEIPDITETVTATITDSVIEIVTDSVNTNSKVNNKKIQQKIQKKLQKDISLPAKKETSNTRTTEDIKKMTEEALFASLSNKGDYAQFPSDVKPIVEKMVLWNFKPPTSKGKTFGKWISNCREILDACGEFGYEILDELHKDWYSYQETHNGLAPYNVYDPGSLVSAVTGKARLLRENNHNSLWEDKRKPEHHSNLDL